MRIAFLVDQFPVLSETPYLNQITGMVRRGHEVDVYADYPPANGQWHPDVDRLGLRASTHYSAPVPRAVPLRIVGALRLVLGAAGPARRIVRRALDPTRVGAHAGSFRLPFHAVPFLPGRAYDVVHGCFGPDGIRGDRLRRIRPV